MSTLTVNEINFDVTGDVDWSTETVRHGRPVACFIKATVRVPDSVHPGKLDTTSGIVRLMLDDGRVFEGHNMVRSGRMEIVGDSTFVVYESQQVDQV